jgi:3-oxoacyl-[acyl-carrier protein] reductase
MLDYTNVLAGKRAVITGAGKGIGKAIAIAFAEKGAEVACMSRTKSDLDATVGTIESNGGSALALPCDVTDLEAVQHVFYVLEREWGRIDILMANAGGNLENRSVEDSDPTVWKKVIDVNLTGVYYCAKHAIPLLKKNGGGKIVVTGSGMGRKGKAEVSAYACAKAGAWMLTRVLAQELRNDNISVNELVPGPVETNQEARGIKNWRQGFEELGEWVKTPEDVVPLALFLVTQPLEGPTAQAYSLMRRDI